MPDVTHFGLRQWEQLQERAKADFFKQLGPMPSYRSVKKFVPNLNPITSLQWVAMLVFFVEFIFTSIKIGSGAGPYAEHLLLVMTHGDISSIEARTAALRAIDPLILDLFSGITALMFILLATPALIYFKLLDHEVATQKAKKRTEIVSLRAEWYKLLTLDWITPRLPMTITYLSIAWITYVSVTGGGNVFEIVLPILAGVGFAQTVADILEKNAEYRRLVWGEVEQRQKRWAHRRKNYMADNQFLEDFYLRVRDGLVNMVVGGQRVNSWLEDADPQEVDNAVLDEYRRFTGNQAFAGRVQDLDYTIAATKSEKRTPPNDAATWTPETLYRDLQTRGITAGYTEAQLNLDYDAKYKARSAWRGGARTKLEQGQ
jgi:hypothetical protein